MRHWQSGERHFHRKTAVSGVASFYVLRPMVNSTSSPSVPLSAPPHRTLVDFSSELPLFERVGRVLRWPWRKPVAVAVLSVEKNCRFNIVTG